MLSDMAFALCLYKTTGSCTSQVWKCHAHNLVCCGCCTLITAKQWCLHRCLALICADFSTNKRMPGSYFSITGGLRAAHLTFSLVTGSMKGARVR